MPNLVSALARTAALTILLTSILTIAGRASAGSPVCENLFSRDLGAYDWKLMPALPPQAADAISNREINALIQKSANAKLMGEEFKKRLSASQVQFKLELKSGFSLEIFKEMLGKPEVINLVRDGKKTKLFSTELLARNSSYHMSELKVTPDEKHLAVKIEKHGSLDNFEIRIFDLATLTETKKLDNVNASQFEWVNNDTLFYSEFDPTSHEIVQGRLVKFSIATGATSPNSQSFIQGKDGWSAITNSSWILQNISGTSIPVPGVYLKEVIGGFRNGVVVTTEIPNLNKKIEFIYADSNGQAVKQTLRSVDDGIIDEVKVVNEQVLVQLKMGGRHWIERILPPNGKFEGATETIGVPACCAIKSLKFDDTGKKLVARLYSPVSEGEFHYDFKNHNWDETDIEAQLSKHEGVEYAIELVGIRSGDGTLVPTRLSRLKNLPKDGDRPVYIEAYGGFGRDGRIDSSLSPTERRFLKQGGIMAFPAVRGGGENGPKWHEQGARINKQNSNDDLKAVADYFSNGWTHAERIITTGASNGGFLVASAGLQYPTHFGLVIPFAGVHDQLHIDTLDPRFVNGWRLEYGDPRVATDRPMLAKLSPVELAKKGAMPNMLIISGLDDSRVNSLHSDHLYQTLKQNQQLGKTVTMLQIKNSGHFLYSPGYQDTIAWRTSVVKWAMIFDYSGMKFEP